MYSPGICLEKVWNQEEAEDGKEEGERGEEEEAGRRAGKTQAISGSRHTSGESQTKQVHGGPAVLRSIMYVNHLSAIMEINHKVKKKKAVLQNTNY